MVFDGQGWQEEGCNGCRRQERTGAVACWSSTAWMFALAALRLGDSLADGPRKEQPGKQKSGRHDGGLDSPGIGPRPCHPEAGRADHANPSKSQSTQRGPGNTGCSIWRSPVRPFCLASPDVAIVFDTLDRYPRSPLIASLQRPLLERFWLLDSGF